MSVYKTNMQLAQDKDKIVYYDYLSYKRAAGWWTGLINDDWIRPRKIKKARYNAEFLQNLPEYYFLGFPIKELLKHSFADGHCHACAVALSLYFKDFKIVTCNLKNYADYYTEVSGKKTDYEHTFLLVNIEDRETVIDTTFGFITDFETYKDIFNPKNIQIITSKQMEKVKPYQFIKSLKDYIAPPWGYNHIYNKETNEWYPTEEQKEYSKIISDYMEMCLNFDSDNNHLKDFFNRCLYRVSHNQCHESWRCCLANKICNVKYEYPKVNLFSLEDDEFDENLYSTYKDSIARNEAILKSYHSEENIEEEEKTNIFKETINTFKQLVLSKKRKSNYHHYF